MHFEIFLAQLVLALFVAKISGEIAERFHQPAVLGELVAGILVGTSVLGGASALPGISHLVIDGSNELLKTMGEVGAVLLLFEAGLESDIAELRRLGGAALWVAIVGMVIPFFLGLGVAMLLHQPMSTAVFLGAALTATSVGITARTFADLKLSGTVEAKIVLGAAVADDIFGLILLAIISGIYATGGQEARSPLLVAGSALLFLVASLTIGLYLAPWILKQVARMKTRAALSTSALILCFSFAVLGSLLGGLAPIVGAFAAGLVLARTEHRVHFEEKIKPVADLFIPLFFVMMGAAMPLSGLNPFTASGRQTLAITAGLSFVAVIGKILSGYTLPMRGVSRSLIGIGMVPRGEVGLIFASIGMSKGLMAKDLFTTIVMTVMVTTFVTPPLLKMVSNRKSSAFSLEDPTTVS